MATGITVRSRVVSYSSARARAIAVSNAGRSICTHSFERAVTRNFGCKVVGIIRWARDGSCHLVQISINAYQSVGLDSSSGLPKC